MEECIAIIPARGGSKRIPRKNIKLFCGKPIIAYSIEAAKSSCCFTETMVSTDDEEIASIAKTAGAHIPYLRSAKTADDFASLEDVVYEALEFYRKSGRTFDSFCCILATAPFINGKTIINGYKTFFALKANCVFSVVRYGYPIQRALRIKNDRIEMISPEYIDARSNDLEPTYHDAGQFYWMNVNAFLSERQIISKNAAPYVLTESMVQDIDTEEDWKIAEAKFTLNKTLAENE